MAVDAVAEAVEDVLSLVVSAKVGDCTNEEVLRSFGIPDFDACFVCVSSDFNNSLQITSLLKDLGARKIICKANDDIHKKFLLRNGADQVIYPEKEAAVSLAVSESSDDIFDCIPMTAEYSIYELKVPDRWVGKSILDLSIRSKYHLNVLGLKVDGAIQPMPDASHIFRDDEHMMVMGLVEDVRRLVR
jgi:trk system potassium uptake protein TrkA